MPSTVIRRFDYCADTRDLIIEFTTCRRYVYPNVPEQVVDGMRQALAKGVYFNRNIRNRYPFREVWPKP